MGNQIFRNVQIPLLWGKRAIIVDKEGRISVISLEGNEAVVEVLGNMPAPGIQYELIGSGFKIIIEGQELYSFDPETYIITGLALNLQECQISPAGIRVGTNTFSGNTIIGAGVGIVVDEHGIGMGAPLPEGLAKLVIWHNKTRSIKSHTYPHPTMSEAMMEAVADAYDEVIHL